MASACTNSMVLGKFNQFNNNKNECVQWLQTLHNPSEIPAPSEMSYFSALNSCIQKHKSLSKSKHRTAGKIKYDDFLQCEFNFPQASLNMRKAKGVYMACSCENKCYCSYQSVSIKLSGDLNCKQTENEQLQSKVIELKKNKTSKQTVKKMKNEIKFLNNRIKVLIKKNQVKSATLRRIRLQKSRTDAKNIKLNNQIINLEKEQEALNVTITEQGNAYCELENNTDITKTENNELIEERDWLADMLEADVGIISFFDSVSNKYTYELRQCIYYTAL